MDNEEAKRSEALPQRLAPVLERLRGGVIVSCQAPDDSPLNDPHVIAAMALAAQRQGAVGVRINGPENIRATRARVSIPIIGIHKVVAPNSPVYITPTRQIAEGLRDCGADIIALDATHRPRPDGALIGPLLAQLRATLGIPVMADIAREEEGIAAAEAGADLVATTLAGYTDETRGTPLPALELVDRQTHAAVSGGTIPLRSRRATQAAGKRRGPTEARDDHDEDLEGLGKGPECVVGAGRDR